MPVGVMPDALSNAIDTAYGEVSSAVTERG